jgi:hypothetical protein
MSRLLWLPAVVVLAGTVTGVGAESDGPLLAPPDAEQTTDSPVAPGMADAPGAQSWGTLLRDLADDTIPRDFEKRDGWGDQTEIMTGVRVREKNGLPRISKRMKRVNHGVWRRYRIALHRPEEKLRFAIRDVEAAERGGLTFKVVISARARCTAQSEFWNFGVRTGSATVQADATVRAVAWFVVSARELNPDDDGWLVDLEYAPDVDRVRIELDDLDVRRIGKLDGDLADGLGDTAQTLLSEVLHGQEEKVTKRIRRELDGRDAKFKVSLPRMLLGAE